MMRIKTIELSQIRFAIILLLIISGCAGKEKELSAEDFYLKSMKSLKDKEYNIAAENFEKMEELYPMSSWSRKGQVMSIYANYKNGSKEKIESMANSFVSSDPTSDYLPYVFYMKALCYYDEIPEINRAQDQTQKASFAFRELVARFPNSEYSDDATHKIKFIDEQLAGAKLSVAHYQIKTQNYVGALKNLQELIARQRNTEHTAEAYFRIAEIYHKIGLKEESVKTANFMLATFPNSKWSKIYNSSNRVR